MRQFWCPCCCFCLYVFAFVFCFFSFCFWLFGFLALSMNERGFFFWTIYYVWLMSFFYLTFWELNWISLWVGSGLLALELGLVADLDPSSFEPIKAGCLKPSLTDCGSFLPGDKGAIEPSSEEEALWTEACIPLNLFPVNFPVPDSCLQSVPKQTTYQGRGWGSWGAILVLSESWML